MSNLSLVTRPMRRRGPGGYRILPTLGFTLSEVPEVHPGSLANWPVSCFGTDSPATVGRARPGGLPTELHNYSEMQLFTGLLMVSGTFVWTALNIVYIILLCKATQVWAKSFLQSNSSGCFAGTRHTALKAKD